MPVHNTRSSVDNVLQFVIQKCHALTEVKKIWLFGSRAKNSHTPYSDYDIALDFKGSDDIVWAHLVGELQEGNPSLNTLDIVNINTTSSELLENIQREGILLYEQNRTKL